MKKPRMTEWSSYKLFIKKNHGEEKKSRRRCYANHDTDPRFSYHVHSTSRIRQRYNSKSVLFRSNEPVEVLSAAKVSDHNRGISLN